MKMNNGEFYNTLAEDYNSMIQLEKQVESKMNFYNNFVNEKTKSAADLGAGSGADSIALAKLGLSVTAFEPSKEMVKQAKSNFTELDVDVNIFNQKISEIGESCHDSFDIIVSLGNTIANIPPNEIELSLQIMISLLRSNGMAVIQILNYEKILRERERIVNITETKNKQFIRFYDFIENRILFNILSFQKDNFSNRHLITTEIYPYTKSFIEELFSKNSLSEINFFGDMKLNPFDGKSSSNLIAVIKK